MLNLAARLTQNADGTWALPADVTTKELELIQCVSTLLVSAPAFEPSRLFEEFSATLKSNGLITKEDLRDNRDALDSLIQLYAVSVMHNCFVQVGDGTVGQLKARSEIFNKQIEVSAAAGVYAPPGAKLMMSSSMFTAKLDPAVHCHPDLLTGNNWDFEVELVSRTGSSLH
jgi:hypothetical protein